MNLKVSKKRYAQGFCLMVILLAIVRAVAGNGGRKPPHASSPLDSLCAPLSTPHAPSSAPHPIRSVRSYVQAFPDSQGVQLASAMRYGVQPVKGRGEAERRKAELVYVGSNPYFHVEPLRSSVPYLVPRASLLLQDIGRSFFDSLQVKGVPLHKVIVTSVMRTQDDVARLRSHNRNATENSCHLYGTTFDICYNRYATVEDPAGPARRRVASDTLKWVLSEVLRDLRAEHRCHVKYEVKQGCFHITVN